MTNTEKQKSKIIADLCDLGEFAILPSKRGKMTTQQLGEFVGKKCESLIQEVKKLND